MLVAMKLSKVTKLLFTGSEQEVNEKAYMLLIKKDVRKKFLLLSKLLLQAEQLHLVNQSNYQRNIYQYAKTLKEVFSIYLTHSKRKELSADTLTLVSEIDELLSGKTIDEYFKIGGRGKASLIELFTFMVKFYVNER